MTYSIIIPHKNIPKLLQRCLDSIPQRPDLEVIVVDDNSDSEIVDFEHFPGQERSDITVIFDKSGKGAGRARNIGLSHAKGKWLLFADADDFFTYCFNDVLDEYTDCENDVIFFKACSVDSEYYTNSNRADWRNNCLTKYITNPMIEEPVLRYVISEPWGKLIRHSIINKHEIIFQETTIANDVKFSYLLGYYANRIAIDVRGFYCVTKRIESISNTLTAEKIVDRAKVLAERERFFLDNRLPVTGVQISISELIMLIGQGEKTVLNKCLDAFESFNIPVNEMIEEEQKKRKRSQRQERVNQRLSKIRRTGGKIIRAILNRL